MNVAVKVLPVVRCQRIDALGERCPNMALGGTHVCYWHSGLPGSVTSATRDQSIWQEVSPGIYRRKTLYPREYERE